MTEDFNPFALDVQKASQLMSNTQITDNNEQNISNTPQLLSPQGTSNIVPSQVPLKPQVVTQTTTEFHQISSSTNPIVPPIDDITINSQYRPQPPITNIINSSSTTVGSNSNIPLMSTGSLNPTPSGLMASSQQTLTPVIAPQVAASSVLTPEKQDTDNNNNINGVSIDMIQEDYIARRQKEDADEDERQLRYKERRKKEDAEEEERIRKYQERREKEDKEYKDMLKQRSMKAHQEELRRRDEEDRRRALEDRRREEEDRRRKDIDEKFEKIKKHSESDSSPPRLPERRVSHHAHFDEGNIKESSTNKPLNRKKKSGSNSSRNRPPQTYYNQKKDVAPGPLAPPDPHANAIQLHENFSDTHGKRYCKVHQCYHDYRDDDSFDSDFDDDVVPPPPNYVKVGNPPPPQPREQAYKTHRVAVHGYQNNVTPLIVQPGDPRMGGRLCTACNGTGRRTYFFDSVLCDVCNGLGRIVPRGTNVQLDPRVYYGY